MREAHWNQYDPDCNLCIDEIRQLVKRNVISEEDFNQWKLGKLVFGINADRRLLV